MACPEVAGIDPQLALYDRRHTDVFELWLKRLQDPDAAEDAAQWVLLGGSDGDSFEAVLPDLPVAARTALLLRERDRLSYAEVAARLGVTEPTAKRVVYVARLRLVEALRRVGQALNLAPLLGWLKSLAAGLTAAKGVAAVAAVGAAAGLSAFAVPVPQSRPEPAQQPARPAATHWSPEAAVTPVHGASAGVSLVRTKPVAKSAPLVASSPAPKAAPAASVPTVPAAPIPAPEPKSEPVVPTLEPVVPTVEAPLDPVTSEVAVPLDVAVTVPELDLPVPLPLP